MAANGTNRHNSRRSAIRFGAGSAALAAALSLSACGSQPAGSGDTSSVTQPTALLTPAMLDPGERNVYFGDLHLHTSYSADAAASRVDTTPSDAYRYARGEPIVYMGQTIQRRAPLDFLAVTDHAEYLGNVRMAIEGDLKVPGEGWDELLADRRPGAPQMSLMKRVVQGIMGEPTDGLTNPDLVYGHWKDEIDAAQRYNDPGRFTAFVAFEYSPTLSSNDAHLHRNVIFKGPEYPNMPFGATDSMKPEALWAYAETNRKRGIDSLMIPHNSNLSQGMAFQYGDFYGNPMTRAYAEMRLRNEPLVEITQNKGTSETLPELSPDDEFADFELINTKVGDQRGGYVRSGLQRGIEIADKVGANPYEYGFVGASDYHSAASASEEDNFPGGLGLGDSHADPKTVLQQVSPILGAPLAGLSASGITGIWAEANTRESLFDAMRRRETFATSGPRMRVRMFGGWSDPAAFTGKSDWASQAYRWGVPMGGNLAAPSGKGRKPVFIVQAAKDPASGNLDRIQIVKLWREGGQSKERIYNVAWSKGRKRDAAGRLQPVGNTVDAKTATYKNTIGAEELFGTWTDPDFDASQRAVYYARVIEIPTPRWATYLSAQTGVALGEGVPASLQERAWTSPVFYTP